MRRLGERIREAREKQGITQDELLERMGYSDRSALSEWESGKRKLAAAQLPILAQALDQPITFFFYGEMRSQSDREVYLLELLRSVPPEKQDRLFEFIELNKPFIIGGEG